MRLRFGLLKDYSVGDAMLDMKTLAEKLAPAAPPVQAPVQEPMTTATTDSNKVPKSESGLSRASNPAVAVQSSSISTPSQPAPKQESPRLKEPEVVRDVVKSPTAAASQIQSPSGKIVSPSTAPAPAPAAAPSAAAPAAAAPSEEPVKAAAPAAALRPRGPFKDFGSVFKAGGVNVIDQCMIDCDLHTVWTEFWKNSVGYRSVPPAATAQLLGFPFLTTVSLFRRDYLAEEGEFDLKTSEWSDFPPSNPRGVVEEDLCKLGYQRSRHFHFLHPRTTMLFVGPKNVPSNQVHYLYTDLVADGLPGAAGGDHENSYVMALLITQIEGVPMSDCFKVMHYFAFAATTDPVSGRAVTQYTAAYNIHFIKSTMFKSNIVSGVKDELVITTKHYMAFARRRLAAALTSSSADAKLGAPHIVEASPGSSALPSAATASPAVADTSSSSLLPPSSTAAASGLGRGRSGSRDGAGSLSVTGVFHLLMDLFSTHPISAIGIIVVLMVVITVLVTIQLMLIYRVSALLKTVNRLESLLKSKL